MSTSFSLVKDQIKERTDLAEIVGRYTKLIKSSKNFKASCPLPGHKDKSPSFYVTPSLGTFYCFGCNRHGDVFTFLELMEGLSFMDALKDLAGRHNIELPKAQPRTADEQIADDQAKSVKELGYELLERAAKYFHTVLMDEATAGAKKAADYLFSRGIPESEILDLKLGFAPELSNTLTRKISKKEEFDTAGALGLIGFNEDRRQHYDFFRDRMMIPIRDVRGRVIGFSGRVLDPLSKTNKYMNSRESEWFKKKTVVYGLDRAQALIREHDFVCVVEGYFDQWAFHRLGIPSVAVMGTALSEEHLALIGRFTKKIILVLDADSAGVDSTKRSLPLLMNGKWEVRVFSGFEGKDPDEWLTQNSLATMDLIQKLRASSDGLDWLAKNTIREAAAQKLDRLQIMDRLSEFWAFARDEGRKNLLADELAPLLGLDRAAVRNSLDDRLRKAPTLPASRNDSYEASMDSQGWGRPNARPAPITSEYSLGPIMGARSRDRSKAGLASQSIHSRTAEEAFVWWLWHWEMLTPKTADDWAKYIETFTNTEAEGWVRALGDEFLRSDKVPELSVASTFLSQNTEAAAATFRRWLSKGLTVPDNVAGLDESEIRTSFGELSAILLRETTNTEINRLQNELRQVRGDAAATAQILQRVQDLRIRLEKSK